MNQESKEKFYELMMWSFVLGILSGLLSGAIFNIYNPEKVAGPAFLVGVFTLNCGFLVAWVSCTYTSGDAYQEKRLKKTEADIKRRKREIEIKSNEFKSKEYDEELNRMRQKHILQQEDAARQPIINQYLAPPQSQNEKPVNPQPNGGYYRQEGQP